MAPAQTREIPKGGFQELRSKDLRRAGSFSSSRSWPSLPIPGIPGDPGQDGSTQGAVSGLPQCPQPFILCHLHPTSPSRLLSCSGSVLLCCGAAWNVCAGQGHSPSHCCLLLPKELFVCSGHTCHESLENPTGHQTPKEWCWFPSPR